MAEADNPPNTPLQNAQPGQVVVPGSPATGQVTPNPASTPPPPPIQAETPQPPSQPALAAAPQPGVEQPDPEPNAYSEEKPGATGLNEVTWMASEFVAHEKSASWYLGLAGAAVATAAIIYVLTKDAVSSSVVIVGAFFLGFYGTRKPRQLSYRLDNQGITIGPKQYRYTDFRSFSVAEEGAFSSIVFMPLKRFAPPITIYYAPDQGESIAVTLAKHLPMQEHTDDMVDRFVRRMRF